MLKVNMDGRSNVVVLYCFETVSKVGLSLSVCVSVCLSMCLSVCL